MHKSLLPALCVGLATLFLATSAPSQAQTCSDVTITYLGRQFVQNIGGINYYRWDYRVTAGECMERGLSNWSFGICSLYWNSISKISTLSVDGSDPADGDSTFYNYELGLDPMTGTSGIKWNHTGGNQLDTPGEYDDFWFVSPGNENIIQVVWSSKGGLVLNYGTTVGPSCDPLPAEETTWSRIKARYL